jgi:NDP-sugar pyrophosphorylase family protein
MLEKDVFPQLAQKKMLYAWRGKIDAIDIGTPSELERANGIWKK